MVLMAIMQLLACVAILGAMCETYMITSERWSATKWSVISKDVVIIMWLINTLANN